MADTTEPAKPGPTIAAAVAEVQGTFASDAALQDAVARLTQSGFDRADLSLPDAQPAASEATPEQGAGAVTTDTDQRQARTLGTGLAASAAGMAAAGAVIATGGAAAVAIGAAGAAGLGAGGLAEAVGGAASKAGRETRDAAGVRGELVLTVRATDTNQQALARSILQAAGASKVDVAHVTTRAAELES
jgi:hypothetical protein